MQIILGLGTDRQFSLGIPPHNDNPAIFCLAVDFSDSTLCTLGRCHWLTTSVSDGISVNHDLLFDKSQKLVQMIEVKVKKSTNFRAVPIFFMEI